jgi:hypothetical protein
MVERADFWVIRVTLLGMDDAVFEAFCAWLKSSDRCTAIREEAEYSVKKATERFKMKGPSSQNKKYINIAGGRAADEGLFTALTEVRASGLLSSPETQATPAMGPLLRATDGAHVTLMPLASSSTHGVMKELLNDAHQRANSTTPDPDFDLQGLLTPDFSNHSLRRLADSQARKDRLVTEDGRQQVTHEEIDLTFGWHEMELSKDMQIHYATQSLAERIHQARITGLM